jgi:endonuclease/exonuclease/phosphatase (EEP) superfamily protein YafD
MQLLKASRRFAGAFDGPPTYPTDSPAERIDYVLAPAGWEHVETRVLDSTASDHRPVVAKFRVR